MCEFFFGCPVLNENEINKFPEIFLNLLFRNQHRSVQTSQCEKYHQTTEVEETV
jgi:hypothetical protein